MNSKIKNVFTYAVVCAVAATGMAFVEPAHAEASFEKNAKETVADMGLGWNLGNTLDSYSSTTFGSNWGSLSSETAWGNPATTKAMIDMVRDSGVKTVRVPVTWYEHMNSNNQIDPQWMSRVQQIVDWVIEDDMYCIINVHHDTGEKGWLKANYDNLDYKKATFKSIWEQVSDNFKDYGDKLLFEGFNEILDGSSNQWWNPSSQACPIANDLNQIFVDTVRKSGGNNSKRNLICNTYCGGANNGITSQYRLPNDSASGRLIVEAHVYQPFEFTHEDYPNETTWTSPRLDSVLDNLNNTFCARGIPVIIGEFGCANKNNMDQITSWAKYLVDKSTKYGMGCIWWDNGSQYKIYNRRTLKVTQPDLLKAMLEAAGTGTVTPPPTPQNNRPLAGDINGDKKVDTDDVKLLKNYLMGKTKNINKEADVNIDGEVNMLDLANLKQIIARPESSQGSQGSQGGSQSGSAYDDPNNLCNNEDNWTSWTDTSEGANAEMFYENDGVSMQVNNGGRNDWNAQIFYEGIALEQGATYELSFDYYADSSQTTPVCVLQSHDDYKSYYADSLNWTTNKQHYTATFTHTSATDKMCRIAFNLGGGSVRVPYKATVKNLTLIKKSGGTSGGQSGQSGQSGSQTSGVNLAADASKFYGWASEEGGAAANFTKLSNGIQVNVTKAGTENWHVQGAYPDLTLEEGATYEISFDYQADKNVEMGYKFQQNYGSYAQYFGAKLSYTTQKQHYSTKFTMTEDTDDNVGLVFTCGAAGAPVTVTITDLVIKKV